jgi:hypothetical protein
VLLWGALRRISIVHTGGIKSAANDVVAHARQILHAAATHQNDRVFLQVVADAGNVSGYFHGVGEPDARDFA